MNKGVDWQAIMNSLSSLLCGLLVLGNFCMMPQVLAEEMPMPHTHCENCSGEPNDVHPMQGMSCANGHCFSQATPNIVPLFVPSIPSIGISFPLGLAIFPEASCELEHQYHSGAPPGLQTLTDTIVLRF